MIVVAEGETTVNDTMSAAPVVTAGSVQFGNELPMSIVAGPCQLESRAHALEVAGALKEIAARLNIGLVYSTQSIESLSPDLLKNTENFFIAHLNDDREIRALTRFHEFRDVGADVQRTKARGFVRMITRSHRFALPVQVRKFGPGDGG